MEMGSNLRILNSGNRYDGLMSQSVNRLRISLTYAVIKRVNNMRVYVRVRRECPFSPPLLFLEDDDKETIGARPHTLDH